MGIKKIIAGILAVVTAVTAMTAIATTASAAKTSEIYLDNYTVSTISNDKSFVVKENDYKQYWYTLTVKQETVISIVTSKRTYVDIHEKVGDKIAGKKVQNPYVTTGSAESVKLPKGIYYVRVFNPNAEMKFTWTETEIETGVKSLKVYIPLKKGSTMNLSAVVDNTDAKITYTSSNKAIASVSSKGTVTAKKAGKVAITIKAGTKTVKLYFKVS